MEDFEQDCRYFNNDEDKSNIPQDIVTELGRFVHLDSDIIMHKLEEQSGAANKEEIIVVATLLRQDTYLYISNEETQQ